MDNAMEYRDSWRGLRIHVPEHWQVRCCGAGLFLHDPAGQRAVVIQPRPGAASINVLEQDLLAWLMRFDPKAELQSEPDAPGAPHVCTAYARTSPGQEAIGVFVLQMRADGGLISGFLAPALTYDSDSSTAVSALSSFQALPVLSRHTWREASEGAATAQLPRGWHAAGGVRRAKGASTATVSFRAWADNWTGVVASSESKLYIEPGFLSGLLGRMVRDVSGQDRFVDAATYAEQHVLPALRLEAPRARIANVTPRADLIPLAIAGEVAAGGLGPEEVLQCQPTGADVELAFEADGQPMRQVSRVVTMRVPGALSRGLPLWVARVPYAYRAPADRFAEWQPALEGMAQSFQEDREWRQKEQERSGRRGARKPVKQRPVNMAQLLAEAERLVCERMGRPLAIHERPFDPWLSGARIPSGAASAQPGLGAYEPVWRTAAART